MNSLWQEMEEKLGFQSKVCAQSFCNLLGNVGLGADTIFIVVHDCCISGFCGSIS